MAGPHYVRAFRERLGITQEELARLVNVRTVTISRNENRACKSGGRGIFTFLHVFDRVLCNHPDKADAILGLLRVEAQRGGLSMLLEDLFERWLERIAVKKGRRS